MEIRGAAAVFVGIDRPMDIREYPVLQPEAADVLLKLKRSGVCGTDIHILEGRLPIPPEFILGHEFIGEVVETGTDANYDALGNSLKPGDLAVACVAMPCGECFNCKQDETANCLNFGVTYVRDPEQAPHFFGGYADYLHHPAKCLVKMPNVINLDATAAFPCAGPTGIRAFENAGGLTAGELVVVQGSGPVGLFSIAWAAKHGCRVVAICSGKNLARMELAKKLGAEVVIDYHKGSPDDRAAIVKNMAKEMNRGDGADVVFEASGAPSAVPEGMQLVRTLGRYIVPGQYSNSGGIEIQPQLITFKAMKIIGSGQYKISDIKTYLQFLEQNTDIQNSFAECITNKYPVSEANAACAAVSRGETVKAVFSEQ